MGAKPGPAPGPQLQGSEHIPLLAGRVQRLHWLWCSSGLMVWSGPTVTGLETARLIKDGAWNQTCWRQTAISAVRAGIGGRSGVMDGMSVARVEVRATPGARALNSVPRSWPPPAQERSSVYRPSIRSALILSVWAETLTPNFAQASLFCFHLDISYTHWSFSYQQAFLGHRPVLASFAWARSGC